MSLFKSKLINSDQENVTRALSDTASDMIKRLAGGEVSHSRKLIENVIVITNASGGTGASTVLSNVAYMANKKGMKVLIIDLNIMFPVQQSYYSIEQQIERPDLVSYLNGKTTIGQSLINVGDISLLSSNNRGLIEYLDCESELAITNFDVALEKMRSLYDIILIDTPMKIENNLINHVLYTCDQIYLVWDEGIGSIANTERVRRNMALSGIDAYNKMQIIMNKKTNIHYSDYPFKKLNIELVGVLPFDSDIIDCSLRAQVFCDKGSSRSKTASIFYNEISSITDIILQNGGYIN